MRKRWNSALCLFSLLVVATIVQPLMPARALQPKRVGLVVVHGDGSTTTRCIEFNESEISGYDVLQRSGLEIVTSQDSGPGAAICAIGGEGCPKSSCLTCDVPNYWSYWHLEGSAWIYSPVGASIYKIHDGDVEGWRWGGGDPPSVIPFDQICAPPPTDTAVPTNTLVPTDTPVPVTDTPAPPTDTLPPPTPTVWFRLDANPIDAGTCTVVRWDTSNAAEVYLDGERVDPNGSREVCPTTSQEYHLRVVSAAGEQTHALVLGVTGTPPTGTTPATSIPPSPTFTATPAPAAAADLATSPSLTPSPSPTATPQSVAAGGAPPEPTATSLPFTATSQPTPSAQQPASDSPTRPDSPRIGYVVFGSIALGLAGLLAVLTLRRR
jgi:hypothetical protein